MHEDRKAKEVMVEGSLHQQFPPFFFWLKKNKQTKQTVPPRATQAVRFLFHFNAAKTQPSTVQSVCHPDRQRRAGVSIHADTASRTKVLLTKKENTFHDLS